MLSSYSTEGKADLSKILLDFRFLSLGLDAHSDLKLEFMVVVEKFILNTFIIETEIFGRFNQE